MLLVLNVMVKHTDQIAVVLLELLEIRSLNVKLLNVKKIMIVTMIAFVLLAYAAMPVQLKAEDHAQIMLNVLLETMLHPANVR